MATASRKKPPTSGKRRDRKQPTIRIPEQLAKLCVPLSSLTEYPNNIQVHTSDDVKRFVRVLRRFGWTQPIVAWKHEGKTWISAGHLRYRAAKEAGMTAVPAVVNATWSESEFRAYTIADNALTKSAPWHMPNLRQELIELEAGEFPLDLTGFTEIDIEQMLHGIPNDPNAEWDGMPDFENEDAMGVQTIQVHFKTKKAVKAFGEAVGQSLTPTTRFIWYPGQGRQNLKGCVCADES